MKTALYIAGRYLFARKSHNVINVISAISVAGMALGTAALILILSVYNGFDGIIKDNLSDLDPDVLIKPAAGKYMEPLDLLFDIIREDPNVYDASPVLEDNVFIAYGDNQGIASVKGVIDGYKGIEKLATHTVDGQFALFHGDVPMAAVGSTLAYRMGIRPRFIDLMKLYYPRRDTNVSLANPMSSLVTFDIKAGSIFSISTDTDAKQIIVPIEVMQELLGDDEIISGIEVRLKANSPKAVREFIKSISLGNEYLLLDRYRQHPSLYKMMKYEKFAIFLILIFVVIIVAFNIFGSLSMLIIEKEEDIATLKATGADDRFIRRVFVAEGWMVSLLGLAIGLVAGTALAVLQQKTGIVKLPGNYLIDAYPVILQWSDVLAAAAGVAAIGLVISLLSTRRQV